MIKAFIRRALKNAALEIKWTGNDEAELHIRLLWNGAILLDRHIDVMKE